MDKYKLAISDEKIFTNLFAETDLTFDNCTLKAVVVTPEIKLWQILIHTDKDFSKQTLRDAEKFLSQRYDAHVEISNEVSISDEFSPAVKKSAQKKSPAKKSSTPKETSPAKKVLGKKISGNVTKIEAITKDSGQVVIVGEVGSGDKNGVNLREFKNGTICVSFAVTDEGDGIVCKKFFKDDKKSDAQPFADTKKSKLIPSLL